MPRSGLGQLQPLASGGTARIYRLLDFSLPGEGPLAFKEYKAKTRQIAGPALAPGLNTLTEFRVGLPARQRAQLDDRVIWPLLVVTGDDGTALGIIMRLIHGDFMQRLRLRSGTEAVKPRDIGMLFGSEADCQRLGLPPVALAARLAICARVAATYALLHGAGVVVGDVSGGNVVYSAGSGPQTLVVDTDSARMEGNRSAFGSQPHTPFWEPPEALLAERLLASAAKSGAQSSQLHRLQGDWTRQTKATDVYKFGLLVIRILDNGRYRTGSRSPQRAAQLLRDRVSRTAADLLIRSLDEQPDARPSMRDWYYALGGRRSHREVPPARPPAPRGPIQIGPSVRTVGNWQWVDGQGWVRGNPAAK